MSAGRDRGIEPRGVALLSRAKLKKKNPEADSRLKNRLLANDS
jgi:hypothetical protein